ncbi:MAG: VOC family protein [Nibricoccus sp.]
MPNELTLCTAGVFYPGVVTARFFESWDFYTECLGFATIEEDDDHVVLEHVSGPRIELLRHETNERFPELVSETNGRGFWLNLEVDDVDAEFRRVCSYDIELVHAPERLSAQRRAFTLRDPNGILIRVLSALPAEQTNLESLANEHAAR